MAKFKLTILMLLITAFGVVVSGCIKKTQPAVNVNQPANTNTSTTTAEVDTSDWKTYRNEEYGFELKYPENFNLTSEKEDIVFRENKKLETYIGEDIFREIVIRVYENESSFSDFISGREKTINGNLFDYKFEVKNNIARLKQYTGELGAYYYSEVILYNPDSNVVVSISLFDFLSNIDEVQGILDSISTSFEFNK